MWAADAARARSTTGRLRWRGLPAAASFLTIVPIPRRLLRGEEFDLTEALPWFPLIGSAVGALAGAVRVGLDGPLGRGPSTVAAMIALVVITGALHQDALADAADGLGVRGDRDRRLAAMRDSAIGAFGVLALVGWALLLFSSLDGLGAVRALRAVVAAGAVSRLGALVHGWVARPAREDGLGAGLRVTAPSIAVAGAGSVAIALAALGPARAGLAVGVGALVSTLTGWLARRSLGGSTGDTTGAAIALSEVGVCLALLGTWH
jgi:adenosylcobinamide-GDP ribazoletransferase